MLFRKSITLLLLRFHSLISEPNILELDSAWTVYTPRRSRSRDLNRSIDQLEDALYYVASELSKRVLIHTKTKQKDALARELALSSGDEQRAKHQRYKQLMQDIEELKR